MRHPERPVVDLITALGAAMLLVGGACDGLERGAATIDDEASSSVSEARLETVELESGIFGNTRLLRVLLPPGYDEAADRRYPVLYMLDGQTLFEASDSYTTHASPGVFGRLLIESPGFYVNDTAVLREAETFDDWPQKVSLGVGTNEEGREDCDEDDMSSEAVQDVLRLEGILKESGLSAERLLLPIAVCAEHNEMAYSLRFPRAMRFLYGSAEGGRVIERVPAMGPALGMMSYAPRPSSSTR